MVNIEIRLIIFFAAKDGEALYSQQKQDQEIGRAHVELQSQWSLQTPFSNNLGEDCTYGHQWSRLKSD